MKKLSLTLLTLSLILLLSSCGINSAMILNHNQSATQVQLGSNNYKVVQRVSGSADVTYVLIFGGLNKKQLYDNAYTDMVNKANLMNGARALANIVTEEHVGGVPPFYYKRTVTVSAHVIEFTK
jgi:hypothetical protein